MGVLVKTSLFICILWGIHIWIKQVIDTEENNQKMEETLENMNHSYVEFQGKSVRQGNIDMISRSIFI